MADQEFLASFAVDIDEAGVSRLQAILTENRELADSLAAAFNAASEAVRSFAEGLGILPNFSAGYGITTEGLSGLGALAVGLDLSQAFSDYERFTELVKQPISLKANASAITSAARTALNSVRSIFAEPVDIRIRADTGGEGSTGTPLKMSAGGRFSSPTDVQVAEDGDAEYAEVDISDSDLHFMKNNMALALYYEGRFDEAVSVAEELRVNRPEILKAFIERGNQPIYDAYVKTMEKTNNPDAARSAAVDCYLNAVLKGTKPSVEKIASICKGFDGQSYYIDPKSAAAKEKGESLNNIFKEPAFNAAFMAKQKQGGR